MKLQPFKEVQNKLMCASVERQWKVEGRTTFDRPPTDPRENEKVSTVNFK